MIEAFKGLVKSAAGYRSAGVESCDCPLDDAEVDRVMNSLGLGPEQFCDAFARLSAEMYLAGEISFEEADGAVNALHWYSSMGPWGMDLLPEFSWQVYLAFDAGEHSHGGKVPASALQITIPRLQVLLARA